MESYPILGGCIEMGPIVLIGNFLPRSVVSDVPKLKQTDNSRSLNITLERMIAAVKTMHVKYVW